MVLLQTILRSGRFPSSLRIIANNSNLNVQHTLFSRFLPLSTRGFVSRTSPFFSEKTEGTTASTESANTNEEQQQQQQQPQPQQEAPQQELSGQELLEKNKKLEHELKDLRERTLRALAEAENARKIAQRDVENARAFGIQSFAKSLLDVKDNLSRAISSVQEKDLEGNPHLQNLLEGVKMTDVQITKAFNSHGLKEFGAPGEQFDPHSHEALLQYEDPSKTPGTIGQVLKSGFKLHERVIRPAQVATIKKSSTPPPQQQQNQQQQS